MSEELDHVFKILLVGDANVGKSCILLRYSDGYYKNDLAPTIGVDFKVKVVQRVPAPDETTKCVKMTIWDTAGTERFRTLTSSYYRGAHGVILVYDVTNRESFANLINWDQEIQQFGVGREIVKFLVGNKSDCDRLISFEVAERWAKQNNMIYFETSAKENEGISPVFLEILKKNPTIIQNTQPPKRKATESKQSSEPAQLSIPSLNQLLNHNDADDFIHAVADRVLDRIKELHPQLLPILDPNGEKGKPLKELIEEIKYHLGIEDSKMPIPEVLERAEYELNIIEKKEKLIDRANVILNQLR